MFLKIGDTIKCASEGDCLATQAKFKKIGIDTEVIFFFDNVHVHLLKVTAIKGV